MRRDQYPVTHFEAELLLTALYAPGPATAYALTKTTVGDTRRSRLGAYVRAGLLTEDRSERHTLYALTDDGRTLAELLERLEMARND